MELVRIGIGVVLTGVPRKDAGSALGEVDPEIGSEALMVFEDFPVKERRASGGVTSAGECGSGQGEERSRLARIDWVGEQPSGRGTLVHGGDWMEMATTY